MKHLLFRNYLEKNLRMYRVTKPGDAARYSSFVNRNQKISDIPGTNPCNGYMEQVRLKKQIVEWLREGENFIVLQNMFFEFHDLEETIQELKNRITDLPTAKTELLKNKETFNAIIFLLKQAPYGTHHWLQKKYR